MLSYKQIGIVLLVIFLLNVGFGYMSMSLYKRDIAKLESEVKTMKEMMVKSPDIRAQYYYPQIKLNKHLQLHTYLVCDRYGVDYELALSVMYAESSFRTDVTNENTNGSTDYGLMQVNDINLDEFEDMGYTNIMNPYQNIEFGVYLLSKRQESFSNNHAIISSYRLGVNGYKKLANTGTVATNYSIKVLNYRKGLK